MVYLCQCCMVDWMSYTGSVLDYATLTLPVDVLMVLIPAPAVPSIA